MRFIKDTEVLTSEGKKVGTLDRVVIDPSTLEITHLVIKSGLISKSVASTLIKVW